MTADGRPNQDEKGSLDGVSETTLWTLRNRAEGARGPNPVIDDPLALAAYEAISYDYAKFGSASQSHPLRARAFDAAIRDYLADHPRATVVALGEGLQTGFWRLNPPAARWLSVDLPAVIDLRERLFPIDARITSLRMSALDRAWMDAVDEPGRGVFITAEGLLMYFEREDVLALVADCARRFPGGRLMFDSIPHFFSAKTLRGARLSDRYIAPPMPTGFSVSEIARVFGAIPNVAAVEDVDLPMGRGVWGSRTLRLLAKTPIVRDHRPSITLLRFGP